MPAGYALVSHADNETNENAWPHLPPASGRAPPTTAGSLTGNVAVNRKTFSVRVHEALYRAFNAFMQALSLKALKFLQKRLLNIISPGGEHATNLIIANIEVLSHDNRNSHSFCSDGHEFGPISPFVDQSSPYLVGMYGSDRSCNSVFRSTISCSNLEICAMKSQNHVVENYVFHPQFFWGEGPPKSDADILCPKGDTSSRKVWCNSPNRSDDISQSTPDFWPIFNFRR